MVGPVDKTPKEMPLETNHAAIKDFMKGPGKEALGAGKPKFSTTAPQELLEKVAQTIQSLFKQKPS
jgi:hypothetical protein